MATINILPNGSTAGNPSSTGNTNPEKRSDAQGWNYQVSRRLRKWLYSVPVDSLTGYGVAFTFTVKECPTKSEYWSSLRNTFIKRLFRSGAIRIQWLTEWQERGVPHLHGIAYFDEWLPPMNIMIHWLAVAEKYGAKPQGQNVKEIFSVVGWLDYLAKHSTRSVEHYQRSAENIPSGWTKTGRMWGYRGDWDIREPMTFEIEQSGFYAYRRIVNNLRVSLSRDRMRSRQRESILLREEIITMLDNRDPSVGFSEPQLRLFAKQKPLLNKYKTSLRAFTRSRRGLKSNNPDVSHLQGTSDWVDQESAIRIVLYLGQLGYRIHQSK